MNANASGFYHKKWKVSLRQSLCPTRSRCTGVHKVSKIEDDSDYDIFHGTTAGGYHMLPPKQSHMEIESRREKRSIE
jgi:hypothetical protein